MVGPDVKIYTAVHALDGAERFWQEPDGIVILDFKTDYIHGDLQQKAARYAPQLRAYAQALSRIYQCPAKKTVLYFFSAGREVEIDPE